MADETRRFGCGCLPLVALLVVGGILVTTVDGPGGGVLGLALLVGIVVMWAVARIRARRRTETDDAPTVAPPSRRPVPPSPTALPSPTMLDAETRSLKERLDEAVADVAAAIESPEPMRTLTSEEMIARAKRRIADWQD